MGSIKKFVILLDHPSATYTPGSIITGQLILNLHKSQRFRALKLRFKGKCKVHWSQSTGNGTNNYIGKETYFRTDVILLGHTNTESVELLASDHVYPFRFCLPMDIPSSFEHRIGHVRYSIKAIIDRPWMFDDQTKLMFTVNAPHQFDPSLRTIGYDDDIDEYYCCALLPCIGQGNLQLRFRIPKAQYACGDSLVATININNKSNDVSVERIKLALEQTLEFHSKSPRNTKKQTTVVQETKKFGQFQKNEEVVLGLQVPTVPSSFLQNCTLIDIEYRVLISVAVSGCHYSTKRRYDVEIGGPSISQPPVLFPPNEYAVTPSLDQIYNITNPVPMPQPFSSHVDGVSYPPTNEDEDQPPDFSQINRREVGFVVPTTQMSEQLPPSYESVMAGNKNAIK